MLLGKKMWRFLKGWQFSYGARREEEENCLIA